MVLRATALGDMDFRRVRCANLPWAGNAGYFILHKKHLVPMCSPTYPPAGERDGWSASETLQEQKSLALHTFCTVLGGRASPSSAARRAARRGPGAPPCPEGDPEL